MSQFSAILLLVILSLPATFAPASDTGSEPDLAKHPLYSQYQFGGSEAKVVDLGTQPMAVPIGVIGAAMAHDRLLRATLTERGWEFRSHSFLKGADANFYFERGDLDLALAGDWPTITMAAAHDIQVVGLGKQGFTSIVAKGVRQVAELKGKRIGSPPNSNAHYGLLVALDSAGMKETDVTIVPMDVNELIDALAQGTIEAFSSWEPVVGDALRTHPKFSVVQRCMTNSYLYFAAGLARKNPEIAELVAASYVRSLRWMRDDRKNLMHAIGWAQKESELMLGKPSTLSPDEMARITTDDLLKIAASPVVPRQDLAENGSIRRAFTFLQGHGMIAAAVPWKKIEQSFDTTLIDKILANPRRYKTLSFDYDE